MEQINNDLKLFLDFCKENHLTDEEILKVCEPLINTIKRNSIAYYLRYLIILLLIIIIFYYLTYFEFVSWNLSAIGRIVLIQLLPYWDWRHLKNDQCFLDNFIKPKIENSELSFDCVFCEAINKIYVESEIDPTVLNEHFIQLHKPVILTDSLKDWPIFENPHLFFNIKDTLFKDSVPCKLSTNIHNGPITIKRILQKTEEFDEYFLHFQNCDFDATKAFRVITPRPGFLPAEISPIQYNWLMISKNYNVTNYKLINLKEPIAVIAQASGSNFFRLVPRQNCEIDCPTINIKLLPHEVLIFTSLWDLEYRPNDIGENIAVILEMH